MITGYTTKRVGQVVTITAASDLVGDVTWHWYLDGVYVTATKVDTYSLRLADAEQGQIVCVDSDDPDFNPLESPPTGWPARKTLFWTANMATDVLKYRIEQQVDGGSWTTIAEVPHVAGQWIYTYLTAPLVDLSEYAWRIIAVDLSGNDGSEIELSPETMVRRPDAPSYTAAYSAVTGKVTFASA